MNSSHGTLPKLLTSISRTWMRGTTGIANSILTEPFRPRLSATLSHQFNYSTSGIAEIRQCSGSQVCRAFVDDTFNKGLGAVSTKPRDLAYKSLDAGAVGFERKVSSDLVLKPWQHDWCQKQPGILSSVTPGLSGIFNVSYRRENRDLKDFMIVPKEIARGFAKNIAVAPQSQKPKPDKAPLCWGETLSEIEGRSRASSGKKQGPDLVELLKEKKSWSELLSDEDFSRKCITSYLSMKLRLYMGSPGVIGEPYKQPPPPLPLLRRWLTKEGWSRRKQSFMGMIKTSYTIAKLRQKTKGYSQQRFYQEASDLYKQINVALAEGERTALRQLVTDNVFSVMKNELKHRENSWAKVKWEMVGPINKIRTLQGRLNPGARVLFVVDGAMGSNSVLTLLEIGVDKNNHDNAFVQLTLRILSKQKFAAYEKNGKLVAGDPDKELLVEDYWVFEKPLLLTEAKWRLCGRLSV